MSTILHIYICSWHFQSTLNVNLVKEQLNCLLFVNWINLFPVSGINVKRNMPGNGISFNIVFYLTPIWWKLNRNEHPLILYLMINNNKCWWIYIPTSNRIQQTWSVGQDHAVNTFKIRNILSNSLLRISLIINEVYKMSLTIARSWSRLMNQ